MQKKISKYIILLVCSLGLAAPMNAQNESEQSKPAGKEGVSIGKEQTEKKQGLIRGLSISADLFGVIGKVFGNDYQSYEVSAEMNLKNRFFPVVEIGYGSTDMTDDDKDIHYKVAAPYFRVGMNYNFFYKKETPSYIFGGIRFGFTSFNYDISAPDLSDPVWGGSVPFYYDGLKSNAAWAEIVVGLRTQIVKNFHMGWSLRYKRRLSVKENPNSDAWYIPGFGINDSALFGATYNLIYYLPW